MRWIVPVIALLAIAPPAAARTALGEISVPLGSGAQVEADLCPLWGHWRLQARFADAGAPGRLRAIAHAAVVAMDVSDGADGSLVITLGLAPDVLWADAEVDGVGVLHARFWGADPEQPRPSVFEVVDEAIQERPKAVSSLERGYMPLGEGSPWSFVEFPLKPPLSGPFVPVEGGGASVVRVEGLERTAALLPGMERRVQAVQHGRSWWDETAEAFVMTVAALGDDPTHEGALALAGEALYLAGAHDEAEYYFERVLSAFPASPRRGCYLLGQSLALQGMGRHPQALAGFEQAALALPDGQRGLALAAIVGSLASMDRWDAAHELMTSLHRGWPATELDPWLEAELSYRAEDAAHTIELLEELEKLDDQRRPLVLVRLADCAWLEDDSEALSFWLASALGSGSRIADVMVRLRKLERQLLDEDFAMEEDAPSYPRTIAELRALAEVEPRAALEVALAEARYLYANEMYLDACRLDRETLRTYPEFPSAREIEARMCEGAGILMAVAHESDDALQEAGLYLDFVDRREAADCMDPDLVGRGVDVLESLGLWEEARRSLSVMMVHRDLEPLAREELVLRLARVYLASERVDDGLRTIEYYRDTRATPALEDEAEVLELQLTLARNADGDAAEVLRRAVALDDRTLEPDLELSLRRTEGRAALYQQRWDRASVALARARALGEGENAQQDGVLLGWARLRADQPQLCVEVLEAMDPDHLAPPARAARTYTLTRALRAVGRIDEAEALLAQAAADPSIGAWADLARHEATDLDWERRFEALVSVPTVDLGGPAADEDTPSEL